MSGTIELSRLVDLASERLGVQVTYDEALLRSKTTLRLPDSLDNAGVWQLVNRLLAEQGLVTARLGGNADPVIAIVKLASAVQGAAAESYAIDHAADTATDPESAMWEPLPSFRKLAVRLSHARTKDVAASIASMLSKPGGVLIEEPVTSTIIIADFRVHAEAAALAAIALDVPASEVQCVEYACKSVPAVELARLADQLMRKRSEIRGSAGAPSSATSGASQIGELLPAPDGSSVFIVAPSEAISQWHQVLSDLDRREAIQTVRYESRALGAADAARLVEQAIAANRSAHPTGAAADERWSLLPDDASGTLLVTGTAAQHALAEQTLAGLASAPPSVRRPLRTFTLKHRSVREVIGIVERLIDVGMLDVSGTDDAGMNESGQRGVPAYDPSAPDAAPSGLRPVPPPPRASGAGNSTSATSTEPRDSPLLQGMTTGTRRVGAGGGSGSGARGGGRDALTLTSDEATNMLIAIGEPRVLAQLEMLLPTLDVRQPQVMIEAMLVSLTDAQSMALGVELEKIEISGDTIIRLSSLFGLSSAGTGANAGSRVVGDATGFSGVVLNPGDFSVIIRALETVNQGRSLSVPKVLVNNNQQATFNSTLQQPYASTNASDTVATTSFGGTFDAGTTITVRPQIAEGDHLVLDYQVKLSSFTGSAAGDLPPPRQENSVTSVATIPDGYTVVVGGLEAVTDGEGESRVPGIGAIPIIGELFKNRTTNRSRARFFVFLRANVMRGTAGTGFEELKYLSDRSAGEAGLSDEQSAGGWPELEPRVIR